MSGHAPRVRLVRFGALLPLIKYHQLPYFRVVKGPTCAPFAPFALSAGPAHACLGYAERETAQKCEDWCKKTGTCSLEITKKAVYFTDSTS